MEWNGLCGFCFCRRPKAGPQCAVYTVYRRSRRQQVINQQATSLQAASVDRGHARARARAP